MKAFEHVPVLFEDIVSLCPEAGNYFDLTLGGAGHAYAMLARNPSLILYGSDKDQDALAASTKRLEPFKDRVHLFQGGFLESLNHWAAEGINADFILADLGVSSFQLDEASRGFSFMREGPLDMRMNSSSGQTAGPTAKEFMEQSTVVELSKAIKDFGEESFAYKISLRIKEHIEELDSTLDLARLIERAIPRKLWPKKIHPATKTFQALRMAVNNEIGELDDLLTKGVSMLNLEGLLGVISFHSLEDRRVKVAFKKLIDPCECPKSIPICVCGLKPTAQALRKKPIIATDEEISQNPRSRSAKLRVVRRI
ncbi:MAG: 16S rRNA (cytosine(1402)-N(4))-methyltransferase RsmH [SAR324 cluster bacterium]|nr:16S rRNA (cytosine(1402)-N(4))-methyltransferase RsmH [SAR324 cluster bacterium]